MKVWSVVVLAVLLVVGSACGGSSPPPAVTVENPATGTEIAVRAGGTLDILLEGNMTTGYSWAVSSVDSSILKQIGEPAYSTSSSALGAGGTFALRFEGVKEGTTDLQLVYARPWETGVPPEKTLDLKVKVKG